jgi:putative transposase
MTRYIDEHKGRFGVEPICRVLAGTATGFLSVSGYYARQRRPLSRRAVDDEQLTVELRRVHAVNYGVYGARKVWRQLQRESIPVGRDRVARLMRAAGIEGIRRGKTRRTTIADDLAARPADLVDRRFTAERPNRLWVADITYVRTWSGWVYAAFVIDVFSRRIVGWALSTSLRTDLALDALEMAIWLRNDRLDELVHHTDRGSQYTSIRYTERLAQAGAVASVGSRGDSYDNALAESTIGLFKTELIRRRGPWRNLDHVELATLEWIDWWNHRRLHSEIGHLPPAEVEDRYYRQSTASPEAATQ